MGLNAQKPLAPDETPRRRRTDHRAHEKRLERNRLKGTIGDSINALLSAAALNFQKLLGFFLHFWLRLCALLWLPPRIQISPIIA